MTTTEDPGLGDFDAAKLYCEKSLEESARRAELYGPHVEGSKSSVLDLLEISMEEFLSPEVDTHRRQVDAAIRRGKSASVNFFFRNGTSEDIRLRKHECRRGKSDSVNFFFRNGTSEDKRLRKHECR
jgi:hypothetical protein